MSITTVICTTIVSAINNPHDLEQIAHESVSNMVETKILRGQPYPLNVFYDNGNQYDKTSLLCCISSMGDQREIHDRIQSLPRPNLDIRPGVILFLPLTFASFFQYFQHSFHIQNAIP